MGNSLLKLFVGLLASFLWLWAFYYVILVYQKNVALLCNTEGVQMFHVVIEA